MQSQLTAKPGVKTGYLLLPLLPSPGARKGKRVNEPCTCTAYLQDNKHGMILHGFTMIFDATDPFPSSPNLCEVSVFHRLTSHQLRLKTNRHISPLSVENITTPWQNHEGRGKTTLPSPAFMPWSMDQPPSVWHFPQSRSLDMQINIRFATKYAKNGTRRTWYDLIIDNKSKSLYSGEVYFWSHLLKKRSPHPLHLNLIAILCFIFIWIIGGLDGTNFINCYHSH